MTRKLLCLALLIIADLVSVAPFLAMLAWPGRSCLRPPDGTALPCIVAPLLWLVLLAREGLYVRRHPLPAEVRHLVRAAALNLFTLFTLSQLELLELPPARGLALAVLAGTVTLALVRRGLKPHLFRLDLWRKEVLLVGAGATGKRLIDALHCDHFTGLDIVAALDDNPALHGTEIAGVPVVGSLDALETLLRAPGGHRAKDLLISIPGLPRERLQELINRAEGRVESIRFVPDLLGLSTLGVELESLRGTLAIRLKQNLMKPWNAAMKRLLDLAIGLLAMVVVLPFAALLCLVIALETPGAPILVQERLGRRGQPFRCLKFRTMFVDADARLAVALAGDPVLAVEWDTYAKLKRNDPRVTPVGRWLRRFSLDELPQLWNVLRGEMSIIGPRPYLPREMDRIGETLSVIGTARPGLTGLWQVSGRNELTFQERLILDEFYVRNWTVGMDLWILLRTVGALLSGRGAY